MDDTHTATGSGAESGAPDHDDGGEGHCARSRRRGLKTSHIVFLGAAIAVGTALLVTGLSAAPAAKTSGVVNIPMSVMNPP